MSASLNVQFFSPHTKIELLIDILDFSNDKTIDIRVNNETVFVWWSVFHGNIVAVLVDHKYK